MSLAVRGEYDVELNDLEEPKFDGLWSTARQLTPSPSLALEPFCPPRTTLSNLSICKNYKKFGSH
jgi:hypothetical protein